jgi:class III poly(R)-hydroxyalkanoic acid synthase PhaE subunit
MSDSEKGDPHALQFLKAWENYVAVCQTVFEGLSAGSTDVGGPMPLAFLEPWKDFAATLGMPADAATGEHLKPEHMFGNFLPALGYSREYQEIARRMLDLSVQFQRRWAEFAQQGVDIGQSAFQAVQRSSSEQTAGGSPGAIYDAWIDGAEEAYARAAHSEAFARLLADICNTLSAFKMERGKMLEAFARHLDWPSRAEVDSLHHQVRNLTAAAAKTAAAKTAAAKTAAPTTAKPATAATTTAKANDGFKTTSRGKTAAKAAKTAKTARAAPAARAGKFKVRHRGV